MALTIGTAPLADVDVHIRRGTTVPIALQFSETDDAGAVVVQDFAGWSVRSQVRRRPGGDVWLDVGALLTLTVTGGVLTASGSIPATVTEATEWDTRTAGVWDVELVRADGSVICWAAGQVVVTGDVTRAVTP